MCTIEGIYHLIDKFRELMGVIAGTTSVPKDRYNKNNDTFNNSCISNDMSDIPNVTKDKIRIRKGPHDE